MDGVNEATVIVMEITVACMALFQNTNSGSLRWNGLNSSESLRRKYCHNLLHSYDYRVGRTGELLSSSST